MKKYTTLISRGGSDAQLLDFKYQQDWFIEIQKDSSSILEIRKLREAILSSKRSDEFAIKVYEYSVDECLKAKEYPELFKSLAQLINNLYPREMKLVDDPNNVHPLDNSKRYCLSLYLLYLVCLVPNLSCGELHFSLERCQKIESNYELYNVGIKWYNALKANNFVSLKAILEGANLNEQILMHESLKIARPRIVSMLSKSFYTIPNNVLMGYLLIKDDDDFNDLNLKVVGGTVILKQRKIHK